MFLLGTTVHLNPFQRMGTVETTTLHVLDPGCLPIPLPRNGHPPYFPKRIELLIFSRVVRTRQPTFSSMAKFMLRRHIIPNPPFSFWQQTVSYLTVKFPLATHFSPKKCSAQFVNFIQDAFRKCSQLPGIQGYS